MDPRSVGHALSQIADFLELKGENRFKSAAYRNAARAVLACRPTISLPRSRPASSRS